MCSSLYELDAHAAFSDIYWNICPIGSKGIRKGFIYRWLTSYGIIYADVIGTAVYSYIVEYRARGDEILAILDRHRIDTNDRIL